MRGQGKACISAAVELCLDGGPAFQRGPLFFFRRPEGIICDLYGSPMHGPALFQKDTVTRCRVAAAPLQDISILTGKMAHPIGQRRSVFGQPLSQQKVQKDSSAESMGYNDGSNSWMRQIEPLRRASDHCLPKTVPARRFGNWYLWHLLVPLGVCPTSGHAWVLQRKYLNIRMQLHAVVASCDISSFQFPGSALSVPDTRIILRLHRTWKTSSNACPHLNCHPVK